MEIRPSADIRNKYAEISQYCKESKEPVFVTVNGKGDTVIMNIRAYDEQQNKILLLQKLNKAKDDIINGRVYAQEEVFAELQTKINEKLGSS